VGGSSIDQRSREYVALVELGWVLIDVLLGDTTAKFKRRLSADEKVIRQGVMDIYHLTRAASSVFRCAKNRSQLRKAKMPLQQQVEDQCNRPSTLLTVEDINLNIFLRFLNQSTILLMK
jgi:hypothetical protein